MKKRITDMEVLVISIILSVVLCYFTPGCIIDNSVKEVLNEAITTTDTTVVTDTVIKEIPVFDKGIIISSYNKGYMDGAFASIRTANNETGYEGFFKIKTLDSLKFVQLIYSVKP